MVHRCGAGLRTRDTDRTCKHRSLNSAAHQMAYPSGQPVPPRERRGRAGVTRARGACGGPGLCVFCFSVLMGRSNTLTSPSGHVPVLCGCRVASVGTCCPTYLPRALCSPIPASPLALLSAGEGRRPWAVLSAACERPRLIGGGGPGSFWCYQTRASDPKWSGSTWGTMSLTNRETLGILYHSARASALASASASASNETMRSPLRL